MAINTDSDKFLIDAYTGKGGFSDGSYLVPHQRESDAKFSRRQELSTYPNYVRKIVNVYLGLLWKVPPKRELNSPAYQEFINNADGLWRGIDATMLIMQRVALILGTAYIIVDKPAEEAETAEDEKLPYLSLRNRQQLVSEKKNELGEWDEVVFQELVERDGVKKIQYKRFDRFGWAVSDDSSFRKILNSGSYSLGVVPVVPIYASEPIGLSDTSATSFVHDLAKLNWELFNMKSELRELFRAQAFSILTLPARDATERQRLSKLVVSTENALTFDPDGGGVPGYISPSPSPIEMYENSIAGIVESIYKVANLEFVGGVQQSGVALSFHFQEANSALSGISKMTEVAENRVARIVSLWMNEEFDGAIKYNSEFNMSNLKEEIQNAMDAISLGVSPTFDNQVKKKLAKSYLGSSVDSDVLIDIDNEIDDEIDYSNQLDDEVNN